MCHCEGNKGYLPTSIHKVRGNCFFSRIHQQESRRGSQQALHPHPYPNGQPRHPHLPRNHWDQSYNFYGCLHQSPQEVWVSWGNPRLPNHSVHSLFWSHLPPFPTSTWWFSWSVISKTTCIFYSHLLLWTVPSPSCSNDVWLLLRTHSPADLHSGGCFLPHPPRTRSKVRWGRLSSSLFFPFSLKLPSCASYLSDYVTRCLMITCFPLGYHHPRTLALLKKIFSYSLLLSPAHFPSSEFLEVLYTHGCSYLCLSSGTGPPLSCPPPCFGPSHTQTPALRIILTSNTPFRLLPMSFVNLLSYRLHLNMLSTQ